MKDRLARQNERGRLIPAIGLLLLATALAALVSPFDGLTQPSQITRGTAQGTLQFKPNPPDPTPMKAETAPDALPFPYLRFLSVLILSAITGTFRLANRFRRYWWLGVFTNVYAVIYIVLGVIFCVVSSIIGGGLSSLYSIHGLTSIQMTGSLVGNFLGIIAALFSAGVRFRPPVGTQGGSRPGDLQMQPRVNPWFAVVEEKIGDSIRNRLHREITAVSVEYDWKSIKLALRQALGEEMVMRSSPSEIYVDELKFIDLLPSKGTGKPDHDQGKKYDALCRLLTHCKFRRLKHFLLAAKSGEART